MRNLMFLLAGLLAFFTLTAHADDAKAPTLTLNTTGFLDQTVLPVLYTCDSKDVSPEFDWANLPAKTQSLALILTDPDAPNGTFYHWVVYDIPPSGVTFPEGMEKVPAGVMVGKNSFSKERYNGPCPPKGAAHIYLFTLYALDTKLKLPAGADGPAVMKAMQGHIIDKVTLTATYSRWLK
ncbi:MAG: YbhB/YbcL family Raf kinase inhibitor-like protein [Gammaproteobacteria bacterium]|nr:MAG: YbhB/YbcL family Raf kinase inhibitor-like protein [Gammaproteobacteria bacterium]